MLVYASSSSMWYIYGNLCIGCMAISTGFMAMACVQCTLREVCLCPLNVRSNLYHVNIMYFNL